MKHFHVLSIIILFSSCSKSKLDETNQSGCIFDSNSYEYQLNNQWPIEQLNELIDIQFPSRFNGGITYTFEGNYFSKFDYSDSTFYNRYFGGATFLESFGPFLKDSTATSDYYKIYRRPYSYDSVLLDKSIIFQANGLRQGILFYTYTQKFYAKLYWLNQNDYHQLLAISSLNCDESEISSILRTIKYH